MRDEKPGDLSVRISFARTYGGPDAGKVIPGIEITDGPSGLSLRLELTPEQLSELLAGGAARVDAAQVQGFSGLTQWGRYLWTKTEYVDVMMDDYNKPDPSRLPHVAAKLNEMRVQGWKCDTPRLNDNSSKWVIVGRQYRDDPL